MIALLSLVDYACTAEGQPESAHPKFLGAQSCSSSSCHGGAGDNRHQYTIWSKLDFHHERPYATLTTRRSALMAEALKLGDPTQSARCTVCHAPFQTVPAPQLAKGVGIKEGVSCESCHGPAENWLRSHTRPDFSHQDRVNAGMRDLKNLYVRANTCVACHQNVDADLLQAGHPELIFELDGQAVSEPKHWREATNWNGAQTWLVGQAVALRELSWQLGREKSPSDNLLNRWSGLLWLLQKTSTADDELSAPPADSLPPGVENFQRVQDWGDQLARDAATIGWSTGTTSKFLNALASVQGDFATQSVTRTVQARRAERLALALDRLVTSLGDRANRLDSALDNLFKDVQSLPDFKPAQFAGHLQEFQNALAASSTEANKLNATK